MDSEELARIAAVAASAKQGSRIEVLVMSDHLSIVDLFLVASAPSARQVKAIVDEIEKRLREHGATPLRREGVAEAEWCLLDYGDLIVHIFTEEMRDFYALERLWVDVPRLEIEVESDPGKIEGVGIS